MYSHNCPRCNLTCDCNSDPPDDVRHVPPFRLENCTHRQTEECEELQRMMREEENDNGEEHNESEK